MQFKTWAIAALLGTSIAVPTVVVERQTSAPALNTIINILKGIDTTVDQQAGQIGSLIQTAIATEVGLLNQTILPQLNQSLATVAAEVANITAQLKPYIYNVTLPLIQSELQNVPALLAAASTLVISVSGIVAATLTLAGNGALSTLKTELQQIMAILQPLINPLISYGESVLGSTSGLNAIAIGAALNFLKTLNTNVVGPLATAVNQIA